MGSKDFDDLDERERVAARDDERAAERDEAAAEADTAADQRDRAANRSTDNASGGESRQVAEERRRAADDRAHAARRDASDKNWLHGSPSVSAMSNAREPNSNRWQLGESRDLVSEVV